VADLTKLQQLFVAFYCEEWNGTKAARLAGYSGNDNVLAVTASENLRNPKIAAAIQERIDAIMPAGEVLSRLADHARSSMADFLDVDTESLDLQKAYEAGKFHLIKKFTRRPTDNGAHITIELYDAQAALVHLGKHHGLFKDVIDIRFNPAELTDEQLARIAAGEDPGTVLRG
jgi:hypothetical protein